MCVCTRLAAVVTSEPSTTGDGPPQQDGGDIGVSVIDHLPAGVSVQCELHALHIQKCMCNAYEYNFKALCSNA